MCQGADSLCGSQQDDKRKGPHGKFRQDRIVGISLAGWGVCVVMREYPSASGFLAAREQGVINNNYRKKFFLIILLFYWLCWSLWLCGHNKLEEFLKRRQYQTTLLDFWETCMQDKKQQLEPNMQQQTGSKLEKEYIKAIHCHPAYLTYMRSTSWETLGCMITSWNQDCWEKYQQPHIGW